MSKEKNIPEEPTGFKVTDKRHFTHEGETIEGGDSPPEESKEAAADSGEPAAAVRETPPAAEEVRDPGPAGEPTPPPAGGSGASAEAVDFSHLVMSLAGSAYHALGVPDPVTREKGIVNLQAASQLIDLLSILEEKTRGNLTPQEEQILQSILVELRTLFVQASGFGGQPA